MAGSASARGLLPSAAYPEVFSAAPVALMLIRASDLVMVEANGAWCTQVGHDHDEVVGRALFDVFTGGPEGDDSQGTALRELIERGLEAGGTEVLEHLRFDLPDGRGGFVRRWWNLAQVAVAGPSGRVELLLHQSEDVTALVEARDELLGAERAKEAKDRRLAGMAQVALALTSAETLADLEETVVHRGMRVLGADGGSVVTRAADGGWRNTLNPALGDRVREAYQQLPYDSPLPGPTVARSGERLLLPTRAVGLAFHPQMAQVFDERERLGWAALPMVIRGEVIGALVVSWREEHELDDDELEILEAFTAQCAQTLSRIQAAEARRRTAVRVQELAASLQQAMLTPPPRPASLDIAVRYRSAMDVAQVGGDWYDAFQQPDGATVLVIGDVVGHDEVAAGKMGQLRGLLRALAYDAQERPGGDSPSAILTRFEYAARGLAVDELATVVLARVEVVTERGGSRRVVRWSNAGNPPPVLLHPDGRTMLLDEPADLLLGVEPAAPRHDHVVDLPDGCTLLLYTDGLVERRGASIETGIDDLRRVLADQVGKPLDALCDSVLSRLDATTGEDDIAMLVVRPDVAEVAEPADVLTAGGGGLAAYR